MLKDGQSVIIKNKSPKAIKGVAITFSCCDRDKDLVDGFMKNTDWVDFWVVYYDGERARKNFGYSPKWREDDFILNMFRIAIRNGAKWLYRTQPTMRMGSEWEQILREHYNDPPCSLAGTVEYFWNDLKTVRTDILGKQYVPAFFKVTSGLKFRPGWEHFRAVPVNLPIKKVEANRIVMNRSSKKVCIGKYHFYGPSHSKLINFDNIQTRELTEEIKGLGAAEERFLQEEEERYKNEVL